MHKILLLSATLLLASCGEKPAPADAPRETSAQAGSGAPPLDAAGVPKVKPGLWELVKTGSDQAGTTHECIGQEIDTDLRNMISGPPEPGCTVQRATSAAGLKVETRCGEGEVSTHITLTMKGSDTRYDLVLSTEMSMAGGVHTGGEERITAHRIGDCPAGTSPGETVPLVGG